MSLNGQRHSLTFEPGFSFSYFDSFKHLFKTHWANCYKILDRPSRSGAEGTAYCPNCLGHMTTMPIYGKHPLKSSGPEPKHIHVVYKGFCKFSRVENKST